MPETSGIYNRSLLFAFLANVFQLISVSLLFRYADFINQIGGSEWHLGWIVGTSAVGAILSRLIQGSAIDRFGSEWIWYLCLLSQIVGLFWHLQIETVNSPGLFLARILYASGLAGTFGAWLSFVSLQAPNDRVAEVIGVVGASGFVGMACGPAIGDYIFQSTDSLAAKVNMMFWFAIISLGFSFAFAIAACRLVGAKKRILHSDHSTRENPLWVIRRARPGFVLVLGTLMGLSIGFPGTFLRPFAASLGIEQINIFFLVYNVTAFVSRLLFRKAPQQLGLKATICVGYLLMIASMFLYLLVDSSYGLIWPAVAGGLAHSFLFPSVIALCTEHFSSEDRGVATNLILAMYDFGLLVGMPLVGTILTQSPRLGLAPYATTFICIAAIIASVLVAFILGRKSDNDGKLKSSQAT